MDLIRDEDDKIEALLDIVTKNSLEKKEMEIGELCVYLHR